MFMPKKVFAHVHKKGYLVQRFTSLIDSQGHVEAVSNLD